MKGTDDFETSSSFPLIFYVIDCISKCFLIRNNCMQFIPGFFSGLFKKGAKDTDTKVKAKDRSISPVPEESTPSTGDDDNGDKGIIL